MSDSQTASVVTGTDSKKRERLVSIDAFRALMIAGMIFMENPVSRHSVPATMIDSPWNGLTIADTIFPGFLFIVGVSMTMAFTRKKYVADKAAVWRFVRRLAVLFLIGLALNLHRYGLPLRYMGVLQRIALASLLAWPFIMKDMRTKLSAAGILLAVHTAILLFVPFPGGSAGDLTAGGTIAYWIDHTLLGASHTYGGGFDPEGLLGVLTSGAHVILGLAVGQWLVERGRDLKGLAPAAGVALGAIALGLLASTFLPLNKHLWTGSFVLVTAGGATLALFALYWIADLKGFKRGFTPLVVLGRNALAMYIGSRLLTGWLSDRVITTASGQTTAYAALGNGFQTAFGTVVGSLAFSLMFLVLWYAVAAAMDEARLYIKL